MARTADNVTSCEIVGGHRPPLQSPTAAVETDVKLVNDRLINVRDMAKVSAFEAKTHFGKLLDRVLNGEEIVITRHHKPVARLVPEGVQRQDEVRRAVLGLRELQQRIRRRSKATLSDREVRSAIDEGRSTAVDLNHEPSRTHQC